MGKKLYLASGSPRRRELLGRLKIPFEVVAHRFEESWTDRTPHEEAVYFAREKALSVAPLYPDAWILACDTLIVCEGEKIGKPANREEARKILSTLSGKTHRVLSAVVLLDSGTGLVQSHLDEALVTFRTLTPGEIEDYLATGEPIGKAGGYAVQGIGRGLIQELQGREETIIGLPLEPIRRWLNL